MQRSSFSSSLIPGFAACLWLAGCGWGGEVDEAEVEEPVYVEGDESKAPLDRAPDRSHSARGQTEAPRIVEATKGRPAIPLLKTVVQQLRQRTPEGWATSRSALELSMMIEPVPEVPHDASRGGRAADPQGGSTQYEVRFQRVKVQQELPGEAPLSYDSDVASGAVPPAARPYQGLKDNGFRFCLSRDRQLMEVVGFEPFLERCLVTVAPEQRAQVRSLLPVATPAEGLAYFVHEGIGLIPAEVTRAGDTWTRSWQVAEPVALVTSIRYALRQLTAESADIDLTGTFGPASGGAFAEGTSQSGVQVLVRGGKIRGDCRVDRGTGLPVRSHVEQSLEMTVRLADGSEFEQIKSHVTTLGLTSSRSPELSRIPPTSP